jgi:endothelin-converting enzyme/putative endopeptidase
VGAPKVQALNVATPEFYKGMAALLAKTSVDAWKTYLRWQLVHGASPYLGSAFVAANFDFYGKTLQGQAEMRPRWKRCVQYVDADLGEALGRIYVEKTFGADGKERMARMVAALRKGLDKDIRELPWMSETTRQRALAKLEAVATKIGAPDKYRDYTALEIRRDDLLGDAQRGKAFEWSRQLGKIGKPVDRGEWAMTPPTVNAYYNPQMNDINFPAGVLQPPLFDPKLDDAPNYGNTGSTIGHELTHGFDDEGRQFDAKGNLHDWWTKKDADEFEKRAACVSDQYSQYTVIDDIKINGKLTLGEDVADLGGEIIAYLAWKNATKDKNLQPLDGFTPDQRFFIGMAQWACGDERPENKRLGAITDPHSPDQYRINGVVSNMPEFGTAFSCKLGQPMVREKACRVW